ncbi:MAG: GMC family oxidoreductase [Thermomicrobiales bacterium]
MANPLPKVDVLLVGTGAAGGIAAYVLASAGIKVVALEAGPYADNLEQMRHYDDRQFGWDGRIKYYREVPTWRPDANTPVGPVPITLDGMANMVGGTTSHYGTQSWRFQEENFRTLSSTIERYGEEALPEGHTLADWPLSYDELEPYYDNVEYLIGVSGKAGNIQGEIQEGGNPFESPREREFPMPPVQRTDYLDMIESAMQENGYNPFPQPTASNSVEYDGRPPCSYCGFCSQGCWNDSKGSTLVSAIRKAEATGNLEIRTLSRVMKILSNDNGDVTGVEYLDENGELQTQPAGVVIVATYIYENNRLLLLSSSDYYPNGLSNNGGQVGKNYLAHAYVGRRSLFPHKVNRWAGYPGQAVTIDDLNGDNFDHTGLGFIRGGAIFASTGSSPSQAANVLPPSAPLWGSAYKQHVAEKGDATGFILCQTEPLPYEFNFVDLDPTATDDLGVPRLRVTYNFGPNELISTPYFESKIDEIFTAAGATELWPFLPAGIPVPISSHAYGGTRMGDDPATSVVNKYSISHEAKNLFVLGGSTFPTTSGYNPTQTIQALAWYAMEHLAQNFNDIAV